MKKLLSTASLLAFLSISTFSAQDALAVGTAQEERLVTDMARRANLPLMTGAMTVENLMGPLIAHTLSKAQIQGDTTVLSDAVRMRFNETDVFVPGSAAKVTATDFKVVTPGSVTSRPDVEVLTTELSFLRKPSSMDVSFEITGGYKITTTLTIPDGVLTSSARQYLGVCIAEIGDTIKLVATSDVKMPNAIKNALQEIPLLKTTIEDATRHIKELDTRLSTAGDDHIAERSRFFLEMQKSDVELQATNSSLNAVTVEKNSLATQLSKLATDKAKVDGELLSAQEKAATLMGVKSKLEAELLSIQAALMAEKTQTTSLDAQLLKAQAASEELRQRLLKAQENLEDQQGPLQDQIGALKERLQKMSSQLHTANFFEGLPSVMQLAMQILSSPLPREATDDKDEAHSKMTPEKMDYISQALKKAISMQDNLPWPTTMSKTE